ncbi:MAG: hypothetical protein MJ051_06090 [Akkermansia sp.]|nr:hypothetical protein [Akkermansia sp.]
MKHLLLLLLTAMVGADVCAAASAEAESAREAARQYGAAVRNCDMVWALDSMYPPLRRTYADQLGARRSGEANAARLFTGADPESAAKNKARRDANEKALRAQYAKMGEAMKAQGVRIESFSVGSPTGEYLATPPMSMVEAVRKDVNARTRAEEITAANRDYSRIVILPTTLVISMPGEDGARTRIERRSYIYAVRDEYISDTGRVRGTSLKKWYFVDGKTDVNTLRTFFPDLPVRLALPPCGDRQL